MDSGFQPALVVVPDDLTYLVDHLRNRLKRRGPVNRGFEPLPEAFDWIIPTATLYLALGLSPLSMCKIGVVITPLQPGHQREDVYNLRQPQG